MSSFSPGLCEPGLATSPHGTHAGPRIRPTAMLVLFAWCGLLAGLAEVAITLLRKECIDTDQFYGMSAHFVWMVPLVNLLIFLTVGIFISCMVGWWPRAQKGALSFLGTLILLPPFWAAFPRIYGAAGLLLAIGVATKAVPVLERRAGGFKKVVRLSLPAALCLVMLLAASTWAAGKWRVWREASRPVPAPGAPNILLIVLDTVGAGHLRLLGYGRPTSPTIDELANRGISFARARATCSWTLPSHASMFTGRWPHELSTGWFTPLDSSFPTVAEFLGAHGYATAGFVGNVVYCAYDSGLARGFSTYCDYHFPALTELHVAVIVDRLVDGFREFESFLTNRLDFPYLRTAADMAWQIFGQDRKGSAVVTREFFDWLSERERPERPFFAFLNFYDVHNPYQLSPSGIHRFGFAPSNERELAIVRHWPRIVQRGPTDRQIAFARDSYDDCVAALDEELGQLIDELERRGVLERTWLIITSDHGESFGEHPGLFLHGATLFQTESHVPLVIVPPPGALPPKVVEAPVSLRDLAATIVDISGMTAGSRFPGVTLVQTGDASSSGKASSGAGTSPALAELANEIPPYVHPDESNPLRWPLASLIDGDWCYFQRDGEAHELLFNLREDPGEQHNRSDDPAVRSTLVRMRQAVSQLTDGGLTPGSFNP
jgi:arylsulfatase A-like enzyme